MRRRRYVIFSALKLHNSVSYDAIVYNKFWCEK